jgi:glyoxylase-like metal-dependent hydrolase (beta-lactamase superfamily II)
VEYRVVSIGAMAANPAWGERAAVRPGHATTTLITVGQRRIVVDPGLPPAAVAARLGERAGIAPGDVTDVFLTCFHPDVRRGLEAFPDADWWISSAEREAVGVALAQRLKAITTGAGVEAGGGHDPDLISALETEVALLRRCRPPEDRLAERVSVFPLHGVTPGLTGLLLEGTRFTTLVCGDAVPTVEHLEQGRLAPGPHDVDQARASFEEALEIADLLVLGRDNIAMNPTKRPF